MTVGWSSRCPSFVLLYIFGIDIWTDYCMFVEMLILTTFNSSHTSLNYTMKYKYESMSYSLKEMMIQYDGSINKKLTLKVTVDKSRALLIRNVIMLIYLSS